MVDQPILLPALTPISATEILIVLTISSLAYFVVFDNFEKHVRISRRIIKLFIVVSILAVIGVLFGRTAFWGVIGLMTIGQIYIHGVYFPKHGVNGLTAEPYDRYLEVIEQMKSNRKAKQP